MKRIFILFAVALSVYSCSQPEEIKEYLVDNPTDQGITISIDTQSFEVPAKSFVKVPISYGRHELTYQDKKVNFMMIPCDQEVIINPTLSSYVLFYEIYFSPTKGLDEDAAIKPEYKFDQVLPSGDTIKVPYVAVNDLFIERYKYYWNQGVEKPIEEEVKVAPKYSSVIQSKLFREQEFRDYVSFPQDIPLMITTSSYDAIKKTDPFANFTFECPSAEEVLNTRKAKYASLLNLKDEKEMQRLRDEICGIYGDPKDRASEDEKLRKCKEGDPEKASAFDIKYIAFAQYLDESLLGRNVYILN